MSCPATNRVVEQVHCIIKDPECVSLENFMIRRVNMGLFDGKKIIVIGDRDGVPGPAIDECLKSAGYEVAFSSTECFV